jgi:hypothetical protein
MSGYDWQNGKSNNAVDAEENGIMPASKIAAAVKRFRRFRGCTAADVKTALRRSEWHHTSKAFNRTDFFDFRDLAELDNRLLLSQTISARKNKPTFEQWQKKCQSEGLVVQEAGYSGSGIYHGVDQNGIARQTFRK